MSDYHVMNFSASTQKRNEKGILKIESAVDVTTTDSNGDTQETLLRRSYLKSSKRLLTEIRDEDGIPRIETLKGLVFPASELLSIINNSEADIEHVYIEFCHHWELSKKDEFSLMITGLDGQDKRIKTENGESRVYEFAQSCPTRCPR